MSESLRSYARSRGERGLPGRTHKSVQLAVRDGRLRRSVGQDERGAPVILDRALADEEWRRNTDQGRRRRLDLTAPVPTVDVAEVAKRLRAVVVDGQRDELELLTRIYIPAALEGVAAALREQGRAPTAAAMIEALELDDPEPVSAGALSWDLTAIVHAFDGGPATPKAAAREAGRRAVLERQGGNDGREG